MKTLENSKVIELVANEINMVTGGQNNNSDYSQQLSAASAAFFVLVVPTAAVFITKAVSDCLSKHARC